MENKHVGFLVLGIAAVIVVIIFLFSATLKDIVNDNCTLAHGGANICPMYRTINDQTYLALAITSLIVILGLILIFSKPKEKIIIKTIKQKKLQKKIDLSKFRPEEKQIFSMIQQNKTMFQADIIEKSGFGKAKITRIIDRLEGNGLVERKRRGMTNIVVLKED